MSIDIDRNEQAVAATELLPAASLESVTRAEIDVQIATARQYPRDINKFREEVLAMARLDKDVAEHCLYARPVGDGKIATGPSVRFAEIVAYCYRNLRVSSRIVGVEDKRVVAEGICHDLERNVAARITWSESVVTKNGRRYSDRQIEVIGNAACAKAARNAVFKVIPGALYKKILDEVAKLGMSAERTIEERRSALAAYFAARGIGLDRVLARMGVTSLDDLDEDAIVTLRAFVTAINDGETTIDEAFPPVAPETDPDAPKTERLKQKLGVTKSGSGKKKKAAAVEPEPPAQKSGTAALRETGEIERDDLFAAPNDGTEPFTTSG